MAEITAMIEDFCKTYLGQREDNAWDQRTKGPLRENIWAQKALEELLLPKGYSRWREDAEEEPEKNADFVRYNSNRSINLLLFEDNLNYSHQLFGHTRDLPRENRNVLTHLRFVNQEEADRYHQLLNQMWQLSEQEGITHRGGVGEYRPVCAVIGSATGGILSFMLASAPIPWKESIGLEPGLAEAVVALFLLTAGAVGGWYIGKHKMDKGGEYRTKLKRNYDQLFQEFKDTFGSRFTYGKDALSAALEVKS